MITAKNYVITDCVHIAPLHRLDIAHPCSFWCLHDCIICQNVCLIFPNLYYGALFFGLM